MSIPKGWLCYLAPEIMHNLRVQPNEEEDLPFTKASDVFAFGTVWFELLTGEWPWKDHAPETIIYLGINVCIFGIKYEIDKPKIVPPPS